MTYWKKLAFVLLSTTCLAPLSALAQDFELKDGEAPKPAPPVYLSYVEGGALYSSEDSFRFGRYTGITDEGLYGIGNFGVLYRSPWDGDSTAFVRANGLDLGLDSRSLRVEGGLQGQIKGFLSYDEIPYYNFIGRSPYNGVGSDTLVLPTPWTSAATAPGLTNLTANLKSVDIKTERERIGGGLSWNFSPGWELTGRYRHEEKKGLKSLGVAWGTNGGNPLAIIVPEPVDYQTDTVDAKIRYAFGRLQAQFGYEFSVFDNKNNAFFVQSPYNLPAPIPAGLGDFPSFAGVALPPDNTAHQFTLAAGYDIGEASRLTSNFGYGIHRQNETFLPYSSNPLVAITTPLPRNSLDGQINTSVANVEFTTRPLDKVDTKLRYRFTDRDNRTPQALYIYVAGDSENQLGLNSTRARTNLPYSFREHLVGADVGYRLEPRTRLSVGYDYRNIERTYSEVSENYEHTGRIQIRSTLSDQLSGHAKYARSYRRGGDYVGTAPFFAGHTAAFIATQANQFENHPLMRKFFEADRIKDSVSAGVDYSPTSQWNFTLIGGVTNEDFDATEIGLERVLGWNATAEVQYMPIEAVSLYTYYTYDRRAGDQAGWSFTGTPATVTNEARRWWVSTLDETHTFGLGAKWRTTERLTLGADYARIDSNTNYDIAAGSALAVSPLSDVPVNIDTVSLHAAYDLTERVTLGLGYAVQKYRTSDFALGIGINQLNRVTTLGELDPDYTVHVVALSARYKF